MKSLLLTIACILLICIPSASDETGRTECRIHLENAGFYIEYFKDGQEYPKELAVDSNFAPKFRCPITNDSYNYLLTGDSRNWMLSCEFHNQCYPPHRKLLKDKTLQNHPQRE